MAGIFISYRRDDSDFASGRLADDLSQIFGHNLIFRDVDRLIPGVDYEQALDDALDSCVALIAVIGPRWSTITNAQGCRRLEDPNDWVCAEIRRALARGIRVIPALISGTIMPREAELPLDLKSLHKRQAFELSDRHWKQELELLAQALEKIPGIPGRVARVGSVPTATGKVKLVGSKQWSIPRAVVFIDGREVARMKLSDEVTLEIEPGTHTISVKAFTCTSHTTSFELRPGQTKIFSVGINNLTGKWTIKPL